MINIIADTHTHSLVCDHAYSTMQENVAAAAHKGLKMLAITEHTPAMIGAPTNFYFGNLRILPRYMDGVMILKGAEVNIMDYDGALDLDDALLKRLEWVIASYHIPTIDSASVMEHTVGWMRIANNPLIHVIGHCGDPRYSFELKPVLREFKRCGKIVEINAHSFHGRPGSGPVCKEVALLCAEYEIPVVVSSDAHFSGHIGRFDHAISLLEEIHFPEELILNADYDRFLAAARKASGKQLTDEE